jgi:hypothetical protein
VTDLERALNAEYRPGLEVGAGRDLALPVVGGAEALLVLQLEALRVQQQEELISLCTSTGSLRGYEWKSSAKHWVGGKLGREVLSAEPDVLICKIDEFRTCRLPKKTLGSFLGKRER